MNMPLQALWEETQESDPVRQRLYSVLRQSIIQGVLVPGQALSEKEVADTFSVSRQPVREAFIRLSEAGLVEVRPQRGTYVVKISQKAVLEARFVREAVEVAIVRQAASKGLPGDTLSELHRLLAGQRQCVEPHDYQRFYRLDEAFHRTLAMGVDQHTAWKVIEDVRTHMDRVRYLSVPDATPIARLIEQHSNIVEAIEDGDVAMAEQAMRRHLREIFISLPDLVERFPERFETLEATSLIDEESQ